ncbi:MAG: carboxymuconolactone decarboxylase family protein [Gemmatimonadales bacterium]
MSRVDVPTRALVRLAGAVAAGEPGRTGARAREAVAAGVPPIWGDELLLQSVLMVGYPRALSAAAAWREAVGLPPVSGEDGADLGLARAWRERGEATCRVVYGANYDKLRANVATLHPALDAWMVTEGYGRTLSRPGLDLVRREFCVIAQVMVFEAERQLHSHLRGARNAGATVAEVEAVLAEAGTEASARGRELAMGLWERIRG